ncbi:MAG: hypothetical protein OES47_07945 [Acidobacteriota bacterium]|nr:hypothetical protein [Acidobacteriota bacterium]
MNDTRCDRAPSVTRSSGLRFLLYGHDSWGLGHLRRNLNVATALTSTFPASDALVVTGSPCSTHFSIPSNVDLVKLPAVTKGVEGRYEPRTLSCSLEGLVELRRRILLETFRAFRPHLVIVDHQVAGFKGEVLDLLREAKASGVRTILGLRDIIDSPAAVARDWSSPGCRWALCKGYDRVCVYGDETVFDSRRHYPLLSRLGDRLEFTGYVVRPEKPRRLKPLPCLRPRVLVTTGGGEDGAGRIATYLEALALGRSRWDSTILTGPLLSAREARGIKRRARPLGVVDVRRFHADLPRLLQDADAVVSMAGYNTSAEILQSGKPAVFLPRTVPRREQEIRAGHLARLGLAASLVDPKPTELLRSVEKALTKKLLPESRPRLNGRERMCEIVHKVLSPAPRRLSVSA